MKVSLDLKSGLYSKTKNGFCLKNATTVSNSAIFGNGKFDIVFNSQGFTYIKN